MKTNVHYLDAKYFVNDNKKTVACKLTFQLPLAVIKNPEAVMKLPQTNAFITSHTIVEDDKVGAILLTSVGKSKCSPEDTFDAELGKKLALTRAQSKAFYMAGDFYGKLLDLIGEELLDDLCMLEGNCYCAAGNCDNHADDLTAME